MTDDEAIKSALAELWDKTGTVVNRVLHNCDLYGFEAMHIADPSMEQVVALMDTVVIPLLSRILEEGKVSPFEEQKLINIHQYAWHLRQISHAIQTKDSGLFTEQYTMLDKAAELL